jgi:hypothetical protein
MFHEISFPQAISRGATAKAMSRTKLITGLSGKEHVSRRWSNQLREWDAARGIKDNDDFELVRAFHVVMEGRFGQFRFRDFSDYIIRNQTLDISAGGTSFQIIKTYRADTLTKDRTIFKPGNGTIDLYLNGARVYLAENAALWGSEEFGGSESPVGMSIDYTTGIITTDTVLDPLTDVLTILRGEFDVPARFGSDELTVKAMVGELAWEYGEIPIKEVKL